ncbi:MAG: hypothetical protein B6D64_12340 [Bacteroidetes bacterium 4484_276]|nr:MAG: hypothetical protein B6D64_12340 [Bacteroidetes bacterium 4484_276]OYT13374.1 MAG: hypothetical protein B6I19_05485 [Bacteroidetes bacterium 4572_114]
MIQEIITYGILLLTILIAIIKTVKFFGQTPTRCQGCSHAANGCKMLEFKSNPLSGRDFIV